MALPRMTFLYPQLFRASAASNPAHTGRVAMRPMRDGGAAGTAGLATTSRQQFPTQAQTKQHEASTKRYGSAQEKASSAETPDEATLAGAIAIEVSQGKTKEARPPAARRKPKAGAKTIIEAKPLSSPAAEAEPHVAPSPTTIVSAIDYKSNARPRPAQLPHILSMPAPPTALTTMTSSQTSATASPPGMSFDTEHRPPHLNTPPYVHHFDTYSLVKTLEQSGFTYEQSVTLMKALRSLLAVNLDLAKEGLVSKSDVDNETYLFQAASSELRTEILNLRHSKTTQTKSQQTHLQHSMDIISQRIAADMATLRDDLKGMLNDRRMDTRANAQVLDSEISELNYKISIALNSDAKSDVEGLRWLLARRAAMTIAIMALLILGSLRYESFKSRQLAAASAVEWERERERRRLDGSSDPDHTLPDLSPSSSTQTERRLAGDIVAAAAAAHAGTGIGIAHTTTDRTEHSRAQLDRDSDTRRSTGDYVSLG